MDDLLKHAQLLAHQAPIPIIQPIEGRVAFFINQGHSGNTDSPHQLAKALNQLGLDTLCIVRPGWTASDNAVGESYFSPEPTIDGVRYLYSPLYYGGQGSKRAALEVMVQHLIKLLRIYRPVAVLTEAAGIGLPGWIAAKRLGLAFHGVVECVNNHNEAEELKYNINDFVADYEYLAATKFVEEKVLKLYSYDRVEKVYKALATHHHADGCVPTAANKARHQSYNILTIFGENSKTCFKSEFNLISADATSFEAQLDQQDIDIVFVENVCNTTDKIWRFSRSELNSEYGASFKALLKACKEKDIPTVFWNKDDPANYDMFIDAAKLFDYVFTVDDSLISQYKRDVGHGRVYLLRLAAQEKLHFPQLEGVRNGRVAFPGHWNDNDSPICADPLETLLDYPFQKGILDIYDGHLLSDKYKESIFTAVSYDETKEKIYKKYSAMISTHAPDFSGALLAEKFYELCGCAVPVISPPISLLQNEFGDIVQVVSSKEESQRKVDELLGNDIYALKVAARGVRFVHSNNTYRHRFSELLSRIVDSKTVDSKNSTDDERLSVTAICVSKRPWLAPSVAEMLKAQIGVNVRVIYVAHGESADENEVIDAFEGIENCQFLRIIGEDKVLADGLNLALDSCETDIVAKIDDDDYYGPNYLLDACLALQYSGAALVGKTSFFCYVESTDDFALRFPDKHYRYFKHVQGGTLTWSRKKTANLRFERVRQGTDSLFLKALLVKGCKIYSSDPFNFIHVRYASAHDHTWTIEDDNFLEAARKLDKGLQFSLAFN